MDNQISDRSITRLISLFLQIGGFKNLEYHEHDDGVHQGDILSPLLSNIYLDMMDKWLEKYEILFVRYADDFVIFSKKEDELEGFGQHSILKLFFFETLFPVSVKIFKCALNSGSVSLIPCRTI